MERYHNYQKLVKQQLKGHFLFLYGWMMLGSFLITILQKVPLFMPLDSLALIATVVTSMLYFFINVTLCFLFIQNIRGITFRKEDIRYSFSKFGNEILFGFVVSFFQACVNMFVLFLVNIPLLYLIVTIFVNLFFLSWFSYAAYMIYDQKVTLTELIKQPVHALRTNASTVLLAGGFYVLWNVICQVVLSYILNPFLSQYGSLDQVMVELMKNGGSHMDVLLSVSVVMLVFILVQYAILVVYNTYLANIYESEQDLLK